ncbi:MAG: hypothetical protein E7608_05335 [Ruminococcaceae bacterium]|nr:hypothetical protein [Oscillospiraceae bacterium]
MNVEKAMVGSAGKRGTRTELAPIKRRTKKKKKSLFFCRFCGKLCAWHELELEFLAGGVGYGLIEVLWRGRTHWSMLLAGGASLICICGVNKAMPKKHILIRAAVCAAAITAIEFAIGMIVNKVLCLGVWNYEKMFGNVLGQICPLYSFFWFLLCIPVLAVLKKARSKS